MDINFLKTSYKTAHIEQLLDDDRHQTVLVHEMLPTLNEVTDALLKDGEWLRRAQPIFEALNVDAVRAQIVWAMTFTANILGPDVCNEYLKTYPGPFVAASLVVSSDPGVMVHGKGRTSIPQLIGRLAASYPLYRVDLSDIGDDSATLQTNLAVIEGFLSKEVSSQYVRRLARKYAIKLLFESISDVEKTYGLDETTTLH